MNHPLLRLLVLCLLVGFSTIHVISQKKEDTQRRRAMFVNKAADGLEIKILKKHDDDEFLPIAPSHEFRAGDQIRVSFRSNFDGYVYFVNVAPSGETRVIHRSEIKADKENELPTNDGFKFNEEVGVEVLKIVLARDAVPVFDDAWETPNGLLEKSPASVAKELPRSLLPPVGKKKEESGGIVPPNNDPGARCRGLHLATGDKFRCRGLVLASGNAQANQGTVAIAMPDDPKEKTGDGKLKPGDVVVIDLHLKHVQ